MSIRRQAQIDSNKSDKKKQDQIAIEVEFCCNCDAHLFAVRHQQNKYYTHYESIKKKLSEHSIIVKKKQVPEGLYKKSPYCPANVYYRIDTNEVVYFPAVGSFEVYLQGRKIFSKLETLKWPTPETIIASIQRLPPPEVKLGNDMCQSQQKGEKNTEEESSVRKQVTLDIQNKKDEPRGKVKPHHEQQLVFRYSIDRRNLFRKPQNNYLHRKSMTARNQNVSQSTNRSNHTARFQKRSNEEDALPITEDNNKKQLTDEAVLQMYRKKQPKSISGQPQKPQANTNLPEIPKKTKRSDQVNVYLQPIFPKSNINLENYSRQKMIMANKIHEQRKSYEASKQQKVNLVQKLPGEVRNNLNLKARFNENCNQLLRNKDIKPQPQLQNIKETTEQNEAKEKEYKIEVVMAASIKEKPAVATIIPKSNQLLMPDVHLEQSPLAKAIIDVQHTPKALINDAVQPQQAQRQKQNQQAQNMSKQKTNEKHEQKTIAITVDKQEERQNHEKQNDIKISQNPPLVQNQEQNHERKPTNTQQNQYQAEFEEENEVNAVDSKSQTQKQAKNEQKNEQPKPQQKQQQKEQYDNEQFEQQKQNEQMEEKNANVEATQQMVNQNTQELLPASQ